MIDTHCHLLPGIDDGPATLDLSIQLAEVAVENGITHSILTPHIHPGRYENTRAIIEKSYLHFKQALAERKIPLKLGFAGEVRLSDEILTLVSRDDIPFYGEVDGYKILLLELPHNDVPFGSDKLVQWLLDRKIRPMIAHPERNKGIMRNMDKIKPFVEMGCFFQLTAGSVAGLFGRPAQLCSQRLLHMGCITVMASDAHNLEHRPPQLKHGLFAAAVIVGDDEAKRMVYDRPKEIVAQQFPEFQS